MKAGELLNCSRLAEALGRSPGYVSAMKAAGYQMEFANRTRLSHALSWLRKNPDFRTTGYVRGLEPLKAAHRVCSADIPGEPALRNARRSPLRRAHLLPPV